MYLIFAMIGANRQETWVTRSVAPVWRASLPVHFREVQHDRRPTGSLKLHERRGSRKDPKYPRRTLVGETGVLERRVRADWESVRKRAD